MELETIVNIIKKIDFRSIVILCCFAIAMDIITGYIKAFKLGKINSSISRDGFLKKMTWPISLLIGYVIYIFFNIKIVFWMASAICIFTEAISIYENICEVNPNFNIFKKYIDKPKEIGGKYENRSEIIN